MDGVVRGVKFGVDGFDSRMSIELVIRARSCRRWDMPVELEFKFEFDIPVS